MTVDSSKAVKEVYYMNGDTKVTVTKDATTGAYIIEGKDITCEINIQVDANDTVQVTYETDGNGMFGTATTKKMTYDVGHKLTDDDV
jgi:hypothetical protein